MACVSLEEENVLGKEPYMNAQQRVYFKNKLICLKMSVVDRIREIREKIRNTGPRQPDIIDRSNSMVHIEAEARTQERNLQMLKQIDAALQRIEDGSFGYCKLTGEPIGLKRLEAMPFTALSVQALREMETWQ